MQLSPSLILLHAADNVVLVRRALASEDDVVIDGIPCRTDVAVDVGHKLARRPLEPGEKIVKFGAPIGTLTRRVDRASHVHTHNLASSYIPSHARDAKERAS